MLLVLLRRVDICKNPGIVQRELDSGIKIAPYHCPGSLGEIFFQQLGEELLAEEHRVTAPTFIGRNHKWGTGFEEGPAECVHRPGREKRVVHRREQDPLGQLREGSEST